MAQKTKHTPGPWIKDGLHWYGSDGSVVVMSDGPAFGSASCYESAEANARLIAAAPEKYEVLCAAPVLSTYHGVNGFELDRFIKDYETWSEQKRAVIAKATGA